MTKKRKRKRLLRSVVRQAQDYSPFSNLVSVRKARRLLEPLRA